jgi:hypothetical protein
MQEWINSLGVQLAKHIEKVNKGSAQAIDRPSGHHIDLTASHCLSTSCRSTGLLHMRVVCQGVP